MILLLALSLLVTSTAEWRDGHQDFDRVGKFLSSLTSPMETPQECYEFCVKFEGCTAWRYNVTDGHCEALYGRTRGVPAKGMISGTAAGIAARMYNPLPVGSITPGGWLAKQLNIQAEGLTGHLALFWADIMDSCWIGGNADGGLHERAPYWLNGMVPLSYLVARSEQASEPLKTQAICANGTDMYGNDLFSTKVSSDQECLDLCNANFACVGFVVNDCDPSNIQCWLKGAVGPTSSASCRCWAEVKHPEPTIFNQAWDYVNWILNHQAPSGWLGPDDQTDGNQYWGPMDVLLSFAQAAEANATMFQPLTKSMLSYYQEADRRMRNVVPLQGWAQQRYMDMVLSIEWLIDNNPQGQEQFLYDLAELCKEQGLDWETWFTNWTGDPSLYNHGVNNAQALKSSAVWWRFEPTQTWVDYSTNRLVNMDQTYGFPAGTFCADEIMCETDEKQYPSRGTELCGVVEGMFSYETMFSVHGLTQFADRVERLTFNAMPATWASPTGGDMWNHQYLQASNQIVAEHQDPHVWTTDGPDSELYGLEPNYGCCTANHPQGWPKFASNLIFTTQDNGVAIGIYAPVQNAVLPNNLGSLSIITNYPFDDIITIQMNAQKALPLYIRIPGWSTKAQVTYNSTTVTPQNGTMYKINLPSGTSKVTLDVNPAIRMEKGWNGAYSVHRGPLMYSLPISGQFTVLNSYAYDSKDYQVTPTSPWAYAIQADPNNPEASLTYSQPGYVDGAAPFNASGNWPVYIQATVRSVPWALDDGSAGTPPNSPACTTGQCGPAVNVRLVPYGSTSLRISEMPLAGTSSPATKSISEEEYERFQETPQKCTKEMLPSKPKY